MTQNAEIKETYKERYFCDHYIQDLFIQWCLRSGVSFRTKLTGVYLISLELKQSNKKTQLSSGFEVLTAIPTKGKVFWDMTPCRLVNIYQRTPRNVPEALTFQMPCSFSSAVLHASHIDLPADLLPI